MDNKQHNLKELENKGWDQMRTSLDQEMPYDRKKYFWLFVAFGFLLISYSVYSTLQNGLLPHVGNSNEPIAQLTTSVTEVIKNKKTTISRPKQSNKINDIKPELNKHASLLHDVQTDERPNIVFESNDFDQKMTQEKNSSFIEERKLILLTKNIAIADEMLKTNSVGQTMLENRNKNQVPLVDIVLMQIARMDYPSYIIFDEEKININVPRIRTNSLLKEFVTNIDRKWHPFIQAQVGMMSKYNSVGMGIGVGVSYNYSNKMSFFTSWNYHHTKFNNFEYSNLISKEKDTNSLQWSNRTKSTYTNVIDKYILESSELEGFFGAEYKLNPNWNISSSFGVALGRILNINSGLQYDYFGIQNDPKLQDSDAGNKRVSLGEIADLTNNGTRYNAIIPIADLRLSYNFTRQFSINLGYSHYFKPIINEVELYPIIKLKSSFEASRIFFGIKYQV